MKAVSMAALLIALSHSAVFAACTQQDAMAKAQQVSAKVQTLTAKDPQKAAAWAQKVSVAQQENFKPGTMPDFEKACKMYDDMLAELAKVQ